jgi:hypothetical protein
VDRIVESVELGQEPLNRCRRADLLPILDAEEPILACQLGLERDRVAIVWRQSLLQIQPALSRHLVNDPLHLRHTLRLQLIEGHGPELAIQPCIPAARVNTCCVGSDAADVETSDSFSPGRFRPKRTSKRIMK